MDSIPLNSDILLVFFSKKKRLCSVPDWGVYTYMGEVYVSGQNEDVWCNSHQTITDYRVYGANNGPLLTPSYSSCYKMVGGQTLSAQTYGCTRNQIWGPIGFICMIIN